MDISLLKGLHTLGQINSMHFCVIIDGTCRICVGKSLRYEGLAINVVTCEFIPLNTCLGIYISNKLLSIRTPFHCKCLPVMIM